MKSEKAKDKIKSSLLLHGLDEDIPVLTQGSAICAVEIAEVEMRERAIEAHFMTCTSRDGSRCKQWGFWNFPCNRECDFMESFIKQLEKQEKL